MIMAIIEHITLEERRYLQALRKVDKAVDKSTMRHRKNFQKTDQQMERSTKKMGAFGRMTQKVGQQIKFALAGVALGAVFMLQRGISAIGKEQIAFDREMTKSLAIMGNVTKNQRMAMERTAKEVARNLNLSLEQVAESYFFLASAGLDAKESMQALQPVAEFAKAGQFDLATATDLATDAQSALGLTVEDNVQNLANLKRVTDVLVGANTLANASVEQFSESLTNKSAAALRAVNKEIEEGVGVLAVMADQGEKGRRAGEGLTIMLRDLDRFARQNKETFKEFGIEVFDASGEMNSMADIFEDMENALAGLSTEQRNAKLEQLGFTAETLKFFNMLIGSSDKMRNYTEQLKEMGGITQEVAEKQMASMEERMQSMWKAIKDALGPAFRTLMEKAITAFEDFGTRVGRVFDQFSGSSTDRLLRTLQGMDADPQLIARLEKQRAIEQARELRDEIKAELEGMEIPVGINDKDLKSKIVDFFQGFEFGESALGNLSFSGDWLWHDFMDSWEAIQNFDFDTEAFDSERVSMYQGAIADAEATLLTLSNRIATMKEEGKEVPEILVEQVEKYRQQIDTLNKVLQKYKELELAEETLNEVKKDSAETTEEETETEKEKQEVWSTSIEMVKNLGKVTTEANKNTFERLTTDFDEFQDKVDRLKNKLSAGLIDKAQFEEQTDYLRREMEDSLRAVYKLLDQLFGGQMPKEMQEAFRMMFDEIKDGSKDSEKNAKKLGDRLGDIADTVDAIGSLGEQFGLLDGNMADAIDSSADLMRNLDKIVKLQKSGGGSFLDFAIPGLGVLAGGIGLITSVFGGGGSTQSKQSVEEIRELQRSIKENKRALERNTQALLENSVVASQASQSQLDSISAIMDQLRSLAGQFMLGGQEEDINDLLSQLNQQLSEAGIDLGVDLEKHFQDLIESGLSVSEALRQTLGLTSQGFGMPLGESEGGIWARLQAILDQFGEFGESLQGAIAEFQASIEFGGMSVADALDQFIERLRMLNTNIPDEIMQELMALDPTSEEGQKRLNEIIKQLFENADIFRGDLTPEQYNQLLDFLKGQGSGVSGGTSDSGFTKSVQVSRVITEIQANEVIALLASILFVNESMLAVMRGEEVQRTASAISSNGGGGSSSKTLNTMNNLNQNNKVNVTINSSSDLGSSAGIDNLMLDIKRELKRELESRAF